jgi:phosphoribosylformylglycinamidine synthase I
MRTAIVVFPGSNRERDMALACQRAFNTDPIFVWHADTDLPEVDLVTLPGGFSYGDYLRPGAIAARAPIMDAIRAHARKGRPVLGVCNGFQILIESGLLAGALLRNSALKFVCRETTLICGTSNSPFTHEMQAGTSKITVPVAHHDGGYFVTPDQKKMLEDRDLVAFRYEPGDNPNGSTGDIAGVLSADRNVLGLMPHPENAVDPLTGGDDGLIIFKSLLAAA